MDSFFIAFQNPRTGLIMLLSLRSLSERFAHYQAL
jgi:hypothetical protein